ncbi:MAG TPA: hypothetical protein VGL46_11905 [Pseudonocardiaceae bacterium]
MLKPLTAIGREFLLAAVTSSATARLAACFTATGLDPEAQPVRRWRPWLLQSPGDSAPRD